MVTALVGARLERLRRDPHFAPIWETWGVAHQDVPLDEVLQESTEAGALAAWRLRRTLAGSFARPLDLRALWQWSAAVALSAPEEKVKALAVKYAETELAARVLQRGGDLLLRVSVVEVRAPALWSAVEVRKLVDDYQAKSGQFDTELRAIFVMPRAPRAGTRPIVDPALLFALLEEFLADPASPPERLERKRLSHLFRQWLQTRWKIRLAPRTIERLIATSRSHQAVRGALA